MKNRKIYPWIVVGLLWFVALLNYMDRQMLSTMKDAMQIDIIELQSATNFGRLMAVFLWIYGLMSPMAGIIADRVSRKWLIVGSLFVWSAVTYGMGYADTFNQIYWLRALMGVSEALYIPAGLSLIADWHQEKSRSLAVGIHMTGLYAGQAIGGFGATVAAAYSWHTTFHWFGIVGIVYALVLIIFLRENEEHARVIRAMHTDKSKKIPLFKGVTLLFGNIAFWIILFYFAAPSLPGWATKNWLPTLYAENLDIPMAEAGPISTITIAVSSFIRSYSGRVIVRPLGMQRHTRTYLYRRNRVKQGCDHTCASFIGLRQWFHQYSRCRISVWVGFGMFDANNMPILCQFVSAKYRATAYGIMNMTGVFAGAVVTSLFGKWTDGGNLGLGFAILGGIVLLALGMQLCFLRPHTDNME